MNVDINRLEMCFHRGIAQHVIQPCFCDHALAGLVNGFENVFQLLDISRSLAQTFHDHELGIGLRRFQSISQKYRCDDTDESKHDHNNVCTEK